MAITLLDSFASGLTILSFLVAEGIAALYCPSCFLDDFLDRADLSRGHFHVFSRSDWATSRFVRLARSLNPQRGT